MTKSRPTKDETFPNVTWLGRVQPGSEPSSLSLEVTLCSVPDTTQHPHLWLPHPNQRGKNHHTPHRHLVTPSVRFTDGWWEIQSQGIQWMTSVTGNAWWLGLCFGQRSGREHSEDSLRNSLDDPWWVWNPEPQDLLIQSPHEQLSLLSSEA